MASQKLLSLLVLLAVFAAVATAQETRSIPKNLVVGYREQGDYIIVNEEIVKQAKFLGWAKVTKTFVGDNHSIITQIRLLDRDEYGDGAVPKIIHGGPGYSFVTLSFKSTFSSPIDFKVEIYGKEPTESSKRQ